MVDLTAIPQPDALPTSAVDRGKLTAMQTQTRIEKIRADRLALEGSPDGGH